MLTASRPRYLSKCNTMTNLQRPQLLPFWFLKIMCNSYGKKAANYLFYKQLGIYMHKEELNINKGKNKQTKQTSSSPKILNQFSLRIHWTAILKFHGKIKINFYLILPISHLYYKLELFYVSTVDFYSPWKLLMI